MEAYAQHRGTTLFSSTQLVHVCHNHGVSQTLYCYQCLQTLTKNNVRRRISGLVRGSMENEG